MNFAKLTLADDKPVFINLDLVAAIYPHNPEGTALCVQFAGSVYTWLVKETPEQIIFLCVVKRDHGAGILDTPP